MSCPGGSPSRSALAVKSVSGSASTQTALRIALKLSVVATSTSMRAGRSVRAQTTPPSVDTSPDWTPWVMTGRSAARLRYGLAMPPSAVMDSEDAAVATNRRRVSKARDRNDSAMGPPRSIRGGPCLLILTETQRSCDSRMTRDNWLWTTELCPLRIGLSLRSLRATSAALAPPSLRGIEGGGTRARRHIGRLRDGVGSRAARAIDRLTCCLVAEGPGST